MLIPNKFNGYTCDNRRTYNVGGGVGEAMLIGAAVGGGSAAITGGDPLKGALLGGLTGGAGAGIGGALAGGAEGAAAGAATGSTAGSTAGTAGSTLTSAAAPSALTTSTVPGFVGPVDYSLASATPSVGTGFTAANTANAGITGLNPATASQAITPAAPSTFQQAMANPGQYIMDNKLKMAAAGLTGAMGSRPDPFSPEEYSGPLSKWRYKPGYMPRYAEGGITALAAGGPSMFGYDRTVGEDPWETKQMASGGISSLGSYSDGGRMLKGPGDGMSDSIPASIGGKRPARLADGEFVVPADVVSHLGNGSTDAGAKQLYTMMDKVRAARTGRKAQGREINPRKYMPA